MGTWTRINISGPVEDLERVKMSKLERRFEGYIEEAIEFYRPPEAGAEEQSNPYYQAIGGGQPFITMGLGSKWGVENIGEWAHRFTRKRPTLTVQVREEWNTTDADEPGFNDDIFRAGEWVPAESKVNGEVPANLDNLLEMARFALTVNDPVPAREALDALIKGLE